jgi:hypothetical protein
MDLSMLFDAFFFACLTDSRFFLIQSLAVVFAEEEIPID